jgi:membrane associated rhomboid family serine protease
MDHGEKRRGFTKVAQITSVTGACFGLLGLLFVVAFLVMTGGFLFLILIPAVVPFAVGLLAGHFVYFASPPKPVAAVILGVLSVTMSLPLCGVGGFCLLFALADPHT